MYEANGGKASIWMDGLKLVEGKGNSPTGAEKRRPRSGKHRIPVLLHLSKLAKLKPFPTIPHSTVTHLERVSSGVRVPVPGVGPGHLPLRAPDLVGQLGRRPVNPVQPLDLVAHVAVPLGQAGEQAAKQKFEIKEKFLANRNATSQIRSGRDSISSTGTPPQSAQFVPPPPFGFWYFPTGTRAPE